MGLLREIAVVHPLTVPQAEAIHFTLEAFRCGQVRLREGDPGPLMKLTKELSGDSAVKAVAIVPGSACVSFQTLADGYLRDHDKDLKKATKESIKTATRGLVDAFTSIGMAEDITGHTRADLVLVREHLRTGRAVSTVNKILAKLIAILSWAEINGLIPHNYSKGLKTSKGSKSKRRGFTLAQVKAVLSKAAAYEDRKVYWICAIAATTGARIQEIMQLTKGDVMVDPDGLLSIHINEDVGIDDDADDDEDTDKSLKNESSRRRIPLVTTSAWFEDLSAFAEYVSGLEDDSAVLFPRRALRDSARQSVRDAVGDVPALVFHSFRHTMAGLLQTNEIILQTSSAIMGHSTGSITFDTYGTSMGQKTLREALEKVLPDR
ncbi:tyrosine-type recombinase/integrase [Pseudomonas cyclaminis]|uniref:tyrosine-type recombinase/integrase n=1 Tax=Pseudomonas cyclaminis TaxID=2781239 RepID=UPI00381FAFDC